MDTLLSLYVSIVLGGLTGHGLARRWHPFWLLVLVSAIAANAGRAFT